MNNLTIIIPLYKSKRWASSLRENIASHLDAGCQVLLSDKHGLDDTLTVLEREFASDRLKAFRDNSEEGWVENINLLISRVETDFFRILPHDDSSTAEQSGYLLDALVAAPQAVASYGIVRNLQMDTGESRFTQPKAVEEDGPNIPWGIAAFYTAAYSGAFKGVVRTELPNAGRLFIKRTQTSTDSERLWLSALRMHGKIMLVEREVLLKRYYEESTHQQWKREAWERADYASVLCDYIKDMDVPEDLARGYCREIWENEYHRYRRTLRRQESLS
ncbi:MAG: glycosyltransferase [Rhodobacteraceae bacterium]|nr:glycosyltransferase [Paracoccaceae bacterium]